MTIGSIYQLEPQEVLWGLDRCTDRTAGIIQAWAEAYPDTSTRLIPFTADQGQGWRFRPAYLRRTLYSMAECDAILNTSADLRLDPNFPKWIPLLDRWRLLSFGYLDHPYDYQSWARVLISTMAPSVHGMAGLLAVSQEAWEDTEDLDHLALIERAEDTHLQMAVASRYPTRHINTRTLHLRPSETPRDHFNRGQAQWAIQRRGSWSAFLHSLIMIRPSTFSGYWRARLVDCLGCPRLTIRSGQGACPGCERGYKNSTSRPSGPSGTQNGPPGQREIPHHGPGPQA